jgi:HD-GYP domain-containing protein (c-di-GMP phosphodiesterase class II)
MSSGDRFYPIHPSQLVVGLYIWVDLPWMDHPFLRSKMLLSSEADVAAVQAAGAEGCLYWDPGRSRTTPAPREKAPAPAAAESAPEVIEDLVESQRARELEQLRQITQTARRSWDALSMSVWAVVHDMPRSPVSVGEKVTSLAFDVVEATENASAWQLRKLGDCSARGQHHHALRTMTLSVMIGTQLGMSQHDLHDLAIAALAHDVGQSDIPYPRINPAQPRVGGRPNYVVDQDRVQRHVERSVELAHMSGVFTKESLQIIAQHHAAMDGSGWPRETAGISMGARILALADRFDRLCSPSSSEDPPLSPSSAVIQIFRSESKRYDSNVLQAFIKLIGIYPPSTILRLDDGSIAMVVAPGVQAHQPLIAVYDRSVLPQEAPLRVLGTEGCPAVLSVIHAAGLPSAVLEWLEKMEMRMAATPVSLLRRETAETPAEAE